MLWYRRKVLNGWALRPIDLNAFNFKIIEYEKYNYFSFDYLHISTLFMFAGNEDRVGEAGLLVIDKSISSKCWLGLGYMSQVVVSKLYI